MTSKMVVVIVTYIEAELNLGRGNDPINFHQSLKNELSLISFI